jgi:hypothetical protein
VSHSFTLDSFAKAKEAMIATNANAYKKTGYNSYWERREKLRDYTTEEVHAIINFGSSDEQ